MNRKKALVVGSAGLAGAGVVLGVAALTGYRQGGVVRPRVVQAAAPVVNMFEQMNQGAAERMFQAAGIARRANGKCIDRERADCTSYQGLRRGALEGLIRFRRESGCAVTVSGGTERGHAKTMFGHGNGYKIDIMPTDCVDSHIYRTMRKVGERRDGSPMYRNDARPAELYVDENRSHWDIFYGPLWCAEKMVRLRRGQCE